MSYHSILEYINELAKFYFTCQKSKKTELLDHATKVTGLHRKTLIRQLRISNRSQLSNNKKRCGARQKYPQELLLPHMNTCGNTWIRYLREG